MEDIKKIDIKEFRELGFLQEVNRQFFHPLGLALEVIIDSETDEETLGGIWDYRDDPEGIHYHAHDISRKKINNVEKERAKHVGPRIELLGSTVQEPSYISTQLSKELKGFGVDDIDEETKEDIIEYLKDNLKIDTKYIGRFGISRHEVQLLLDNKVISSVTLPNTDGL